MKRNGLRFALALWAGLALSAPACAGDGPVAPAAAFDAAATWDRFLADARLGPSYEAYAVLAEVGYGDGGVDDARCAAAHDALAQSLALVPVSFALRRAALLCAQAGDDAGEADRQVAALAALSRFALEPASGFGDPRPVTLLAPIDARALVILAGYEPAYEYYQRFSADRYFPLVIAGVDAKAGTERHFVFDFVDVAARVDHASAYAGYPANRQAIADMLASQQAAGGDQAGVDLRAAIAARDIADPRQKIDRLRAATARGGWLSTNAWIAACTLHPFDGCADGLVDALLPLAEKRLALPMVQLAYAYDQGIGVAADPEAADALLAAAGRRWPGGAPAVQFAHQWLALHDEEPIPARILAIVREAEAGGNADATLLRVRQSLWRDDKHELGEEDIAGLAAPAANSVGAGEEELAYYYANRHEEGESASWTARAAAHGDPDAQADEGWRLLYGPKEGRDEARGRAMLEDAAQGGSAYAGRLLANRSRSAGDWKAAEGWVIGGARDGDPRSLMQLASIYETDHPGVPGKPDWSIKTYQAFAEDDSDAAPEARRRLSAMILAGQGLPRDVGKAKALLLQDAEKGDVDSQWMLGFGLFHGRFDKDEVAEGVEWLAKAETSGSREARNSLAWYQCTSRNPEVADRAAGAARAAPLDAAGTDPDPAELDTLAACRAAVGDFAGAIRLQQRAIDAVDTLGDLADDSAAATSLKEFRERLALYRAGKPYVAEVDE